MARSTTDPSASPAGHAPPWACACSEGAAVRRRLDRALHDAGLGLWSWRLDGGDVEYSETALHILGLSADQASTDAGARRGVVHPDDVEVLWDIDAALRAGRPIRAEYRIVRPDGSLRWVCNQGHTEQDEQGQPTGMVGTLLDVTLRKQAELELRQAHDELELRVRERTEALERTNARIGTEIEERRAAEAQVRELLAQVVTAEEEERKRVARELHDTAGQHLTAVALALRLLQDDPRLPAALQPAFLQLQRHVGELDADIDRLSHELRPAALDDLGLGDALQRYLRSWARDTGIVADVHIAGLDGWRLAPEVETTVYRVVQEALTNVFRHAGATRVSVLVERRGNELRTIVEDDGLGFVPDLPSSLAARAQAPAGRTERARATPGLGLRGMQERAHAAGGQLDIESIPGGGSTLYLTVPVNGRQPP